MPIYEYKCQKCGKDHEVMRKFSDPAMTACPDCGGELKKLLSNTSFVLKGSGWYVTDYASGDRKTSQATEKTGAAKTSSESKTEAGGETKAEAKPEPKTDTTKDAVSEKKE